MNIFFIASFFINLSIAVPTTEHQSCLSSEEFVQTVTFLRETKEIDLPEEQIRSYADQISKGCSGASQRFKDVFLYLNQTGVDHRQSLKIAMSFAPHTDTVKNTFLEILKGSYLREYYDIDFRSALQTAYDIAMDHRTSPERLRKDFVGFVRFCKEKQGLELPLTVCMKFSKKLLDLSPYYAQGAYPGFEELFTKLNTNKEFGISVKESLEITLKVLSYGPKGPENFLTGYAYALNPEGLHMGVHEGVQFALRMAERSVTTLPPPVVEDAVATKETPRNAQ